MEKCIKWNKRYELGIPELDIQHHQLFNIAKILVDAVNENRESEVIEGVLTELNRYTVYHTETEETLFGDTENFREHMETHATFKEEVAGFKELYETQSDKEFVEMMLLYIQNWIEHHVTGMDRRDFLSEE